jgi:hypothetical protein
MANRGGWWRWGTFAFGVANVVGVVYHVIIGEMTPAIVHAGVAAVSLVMWQTMFARRTESDVLEPATSPEIDSHIDNLQRAVDAIAVEVERIGEGQRFAQKILEDRRAEDGEPRQ